MRAAAVAGLNVSFSLFFNSPHPLVFISVMSINFVISVL